MSIDISIIIVNWNTRDLLLNCLGSIYSKPCESSFEIIVIDNGSIDGSADALINEFPQAHLIRNTDNIGYARANNLGIRASSGSNLLFLNSDTVVDPIVFADTVRLLHSDPSIGVLGCRLVGEDGKTQDSYSFSYPCGPDVGGPEITLPGGLIECALVWGAYLMVKRQVMEQVGMLDEDFFMFYEDVEWCWRMHDAGFKIAYAPNHSIIHKCGASCKLAGTAAINQMKFASERLLLLKRLPSQEYRIYCRMRSIHHIRRIVRHWLPAHLLSSAEAREKLDYHLAGYRALKSPLQGRKSGL